MPPIDPKKELDEVWLGLTTAIQGYRRSGHTPKDNPEGCFDCYAYNLLIRAQTVYEERHKGILDAIQTDK